MKYKLYYTNEYGKVVYPTGELFERSAQLKDYYESYNDILEAKERGEKFVKKFPLMSCVIYCGDKEELVITGDEESVKIAEYERKDLLNKEFQKKRKNDLRFKRIVLGILFIIIISLIYFVT